MKLHEIEDALTSHTEEFTYVGRYGEDKGKTLTRTRDYDWHSWWTQYGTAYDAVEIPGLGTVAVEEAFGGEGQGDTAWVVVRVTDPAGNVRFYEKSGYYASYDGAEFDGGFSEVKPAERVVTVWVAV